MKIVILVVTTEDIFEISEVIDRVVGDFTVEKRALVLAVDVAREPPVSDTTLAVRDEEVPEVINTFVEGFTVDNRLLVPTVGFDDEETMGSDVILVLKLREEPDVSVNTVVSKPLEVASAVG